jgi:hypothetical protein
MTARFPTLALAVLLASACAADEPADQLDMAPTPTLSLETGEVMVFGNHAVARGLYTVTTTPPGGTPTSLAGNGGSRSRSTMSARSRSRPAGRSTAVGGSSRAPATAGPSRSTASSCT